MTLVLYDTSGVVCEQMSLVVVVQVKCSRSRSYLSYVLHNERVLLDVLQRTDAPSATILCLKDAEVELDSLLDHSVGTIRTAAALGVALVYGFPWPDPDLTLVIVGHAVQGGPGAAAVDRFL